MMRVVCIIPARMAASRFPGKPMEKLLGLPMILHILRRCQLYDGFDHVVVATCDAAIFNAVTEDHGAAVMTKDSHERCTDRVEEAIANLDLGLADDDLVVMVQGDEILVSAEMLAEMVAVYETTGSPVINLVSRLYRTEDHDDPNTVKAVFDTAGRALLFSRAPIPSRARTDNPPMYQQTGIIAFKAAFLHQFSSLPQTPLEIIESVDMLRVLEHGLPLHVVTTETETIGIDTPAELARAEKVLAGVPLTHRYLKDFPVS